MKERPLTSLPLEWLTLDEAAAAVRLSTRTLRRYIANKKIAVDVVNSRVKRIARKELERFMRSGQTEVIAEVVTCPKVSETGRYAPRVRSGGL